MYILAIDTAGKATSAALVDESTVIARCGLNTGLTHSQKFLPMVDSLLTLAEIDLADVEAVAVTIGPGSFTGLRIGIATAKAWSEALNLPLIPVSTLAAAAAAADHSGYVCPIFDARKNQVYCALFQDAKRIWEDQALSLTDLAHKLPTEGRVLFCGDAVSVYEKELADLMTDRLQKPTLDKGLFLAEGAAFLARSLFLTGQTVTAEQLRPSYLRRSEAEVTKEKKQMKEAPHG
ncbi:MAG: tRNA (adenosine(37)-N6)-threonylcarbamoyltransferase complex dimerization subunit type 1 TsaB [Bacillota bacterium]|jgi:tRNA threonylcarbamoyladenosine biosynthesis protein TsaB